jgi:ACR3 family arsenite transporter
LSEEDIAVVIGNPAREIVAAANRGNFDLIIMGTHGHSKLQESMIGSIAGDVIRHSRIPVLVVRLPTEGKLKLTDQLPANTAGSNFRELRQKKRVS